MEEINHNINFIFYQIKPENKETKLFLNDIMKKLKIYDSSSTINIGSWDACIDLDIHHSKISKVIKVYSKYKYLANQKFGDDFCMFLNIH